MSSDSPRQRYQQLLAEQRLIADSKQAQIVELLEQRWQQLQRRADAPSAGRAPEASVPWWQRWLANKPAAPEAPPKVLGLYLWGGVGRGKTFLCDLFFDSLTIEKKRRLHFHRFMQSVHERLKALAEVENTLERVAEQLAAEVQVLVLDEMHINDITDAMIMGGLLEQLFARGVTVVTTSNVPPSGLYKDGLQRANFLPAIALLEQHTEVVNLDSDTDYRLRVLSQASTYHTPLNEAAAEALQQAFVQLSGLDCLKPSALSVNQRQIPLKAQANDVVWFEFDQLCGGPRSTADYIEIARCFHTVLLSGVPVMGQDRSDEARRFLNLIDEFYDRNVKLIISAEAEATALYQGRRLAFEFERCASRLQEMQSQLYLQREHLP